MKLLSLQIFYGLILLVHKVDNRVMTYETVIKTDKSLQSDTCTTNSYLHTIQIDGCRPKQIQVKLCAGTCLSIINPFQKQAYCSRCFPAVQRNVTVKIFCPQHDRVKVRKISYLKLKHCSCKRMACPQWKPNYDGDDYRTRKFQLFI